MDPLAELENELIARRAARRAKAAAVLSERERGLTPLMAVVQVVASGATFAFVALNPMVGFRAVVGALGGVAFAIAFLAYGECRRLRKRVEAIEVFLESTDFDSTH